MQITQYFVDYNLKKKTFFVRLYSEWGNCNFENEDLCKWIIDPSPPGFPFNWERTNGLLLEEQNIEGPKHDHEEQNQSEF